MRALLLGAAVTLAACGEDCATPPACAPTVEAACTGARTTVAVNGPTCGETPPTSNAPREGFVVGATEVRFQAEGGACTTRVMVTDREPPTIDCAAVGPAIGLAADAPIAAPLPPARDRCDERVRVEATPATLPPGATTSVTYVAVDASGNRATCTAQVRARSAFAATGLRVVGAHLTDTNTGLSLIWDHPPGSEATQYRVERATAEAGPWAAVATAAPDATRYDEATMASPREYFRVVSLLDGRDGGTTAAVRALGVAAADYDLGVQPVADLLLPANAAARTPETREAPLRAVVRHPVDLAAGPYPLALLLHGNHGNCRPRNYDPTGANPTRDDTCTVTNTGACPSTAARAPNAEGLSWLAETLASHGYVVASVDANTINCRDVFRAGRADGFIAQRARLLLEHARRWRAWNAAPAEPFGGTFVGRVDASRTVLFGHSRGAEAVAAAPALLAAAGDVEGVGIASVFALAPTSFDNPQPGAAAFATVVPICDGDVFTYNGVQLYDRTLRNEGDEAPAMQVFMANANHNFFNTEWRFDDNRLGVPSCTQGEVSDSETLRRQLDVLSAGWFDATSAGGREVETWMRASGGLPRSIERYATDQGAIDWRRSFSPARSVRVDNFEDADRTRNLLGGELSGAGPFVNQSPRICTGISMPACDTTYSIRMPQGPFNFGWPHHNTLGPVPPRAAWLLEWTAAGAIARIDLGPAGSSYDASQARVLSLRVGAKPGALNPEERESYNFEVRIVDADGRVGSARLAEVMDVPVLYPSMFKRAVLQTARFSLPGMASRATPPVDLGRLRRIELVTLDGAQSMGSMIVSDIEFAQ